MNDTNTILTEQVDRLFAATMERHLLQAAEHGAFPHELWQSVEQLGLGAAVVSEDAGGAGLVWADVEAPLKTVGYHVAPVPLAETMVASWALGLAGIEIPAGIIAPVEGLLRMDDAGTVSGTAANIPWASQADHLVVVAGDRGKRSICLFKRQDATVDEESSIGRDPRGTVTLQQAKPAQVAAAPAPLGEGFSMALAAIRSAQIAGALSRALEMSIEYANTRVQFGKPIGKFQALQHVLAEFACEAAAAGAAAGMALRALDTENPELAVASAKVRCGIAATKGAAAAHAIHGAIGVTEEHSLHYLTRRLWQWRDDAGSEHEWAERLGRAILARPGNMVWPAIAGGFA